MLTEFHFEAKRSHAGERATSVVGIPYAVYSKYHGVSLLHTRQHPATSVMHFSSERRPLGFPSDTNRLRIDTILLRGEFLAANGRHQFRT